MYAIPQETNFLMGECVHQSVNTFYREAREHGKRRWVEKTPKHCQHLGKAFSELPGVSIVALRRDPRDVVASFAARGQNLKNSIMRWEIDNKAIDQFEHNSSVHVVRYEDIILNLTAEMKAILSFINLPFHEDCIDSAKNKRVFFDAEFVENRKIDATREHEILRNWQINQSIFDGRGRWKRDLSAADVELIIAKLSGQMNKYGYRHDN